MDDARIIREYLSAVRDVHATGAGVAETSYYPALSNLLNAIGQSLKPKVRCVMNLKNYGGGMPDGGLFTADQLRRSVDLAIRSGQLPARGAIEAKGAKAAIPTLAASQQVSEYLKTYGIVLITNLRQFAIVDARGIREQFSIADSPDTFWNNVAAHPQAAAETHGTFFAEFLRRACLHDAPLTNPKDVAWFIASYARDALLRVERRQELPALQSVRAELEQALGMTFAGDDGEHFFRSTLVQTLFYGLFSAWVQWCRDNPSPDAVFDWRSAEWTLHVPFIRSLYGAVARPNHLGPLQLVEPLDWAASALNRVDRAAFFSRFEEQQAVQYFYEPFLEAYDPKLRKDLGVWYTPPEIVKYQVARVDRVLREELNLPDGLADPKVVVLDPCCGTGAYLVEVLRTIAATLRNRGGDALVAADLKQAARTRVLGFEIMPAPFVVSHLQIGLLLRNEGAPLDHDTSERVGVYLTNALTGWESSPTGAVQGILGTDLQAEKDASEHVKREQTILVVLGNPPYNAFAGVSPVEERGLVEPYKANLNTPVAKGGWGIRKFNLDDLYVRFFRLAERRIAEMSGRGVVSFISNFSYLSDPSFVVMRQRFLAEFDKLWFDCLNGDSRETGKLTPDGMPDPSVFSTEYNREGIRVGTAVCTIVRKPQRQQMPTVLFRQFWGTSKRANLVASLASADAERVYTTASPKRANRFSFRPENVASNYANWPRMTEIATEMPSNGLMEKRGGVLIDIDRDALVERMTTYLDPRLSWDAYRLQHKALTEDAARFNAKAAREKIVQRESFSSDRIRRYALRPFETRWCYYTGVRPIWNEPRPTLWRQCFPGNSFVLSRMSPSKFPEGAPLYFCRGLSDDHLLMPDAACFSLLQAVPSAHDALFSGDRPPANLSAPARAYLASLGLPDPDTDAHVAGLLWMHSLAIGYSPGYLAENADGIRRDWPRIPLPATRAALEASTALGERVAALLDTEADVPGVTTGRVSALLKTVGAITKIGGGSIDPAGDDLAVTAGWGHSGQNGVTMPGRGRIERRPFTDTEQAAIAAEAQAQHLTPEALTALLGGETCDVYLNDVSYWRNVPATVWEFYIGGYQVMKKWLSYREHELLGRPLRVEEAREVMNIARRLCGLVLLRPPLDANYTAVATATYPWHGPEATQ